jgi:hypothetical protein
MPIFFALSDEKRLKMSRNETIERILFRISGTVGRVNGHAGIGISNPARILDLTAAVTCIRATIA